VKEAPDNPMRNQLGHGLNEQLIQTAIEASGYPLQTVIADLLRGKLYAPEGWTHLDRHPVMDELIDGKFSVEEEWSYLDRDSKELRTIDIKASLALYLKSINHGSSTLRVSPYLNFLIECKQSQLPYIFFLSKGNQRLLYFPLIAGLAQDEILTAPSDGYSPVARRPILYGLGINLNENFYMTPPCSYTFSKCLRKGSTIEISGSEPFNSLVMPLIKATQHFLTINSPLKSYQVFNASLTIPIGIIDGPMIAVVFNGENTELTLIPWVRILHHKYNDDDKPHRFKRDKLWAIDIVHADFFQEYLDKYVIPFGERFTTLVMKHQRLLATGRVSTFTRIQAILRYMAREIYPN
jgi:hypothetical protein